ncbi:TERF1-interacting nuclear factor 2 isoform X2 [Sminthopsis crassicaudata]|uniref:TERF1-interacting nuclear factor 2 isoform X2 n=1 Tax=Sminthopsis crassicaudata TaxID=9301 RepID=UPI003D694527
MSGPSEAGAAAPAAAAAASLRLAAAASWWVVRRRLSAHYPRVVELLGVLKTAAPGLVRPRHHARLCLGLRAKAVRDLKIVEAHEAFCQRVKQLAEDPEDFAIQLQELEQEYGEPFLVALEKLLFEYLCQLEKTLPVLQLQELKEVLGGMQSETLVPLPLALTQYCMDMGWLLQESSLFTAVRGAEPQEQSPLPSPQLEQVFQDPVPTIKPSTPSSQGQDLRKPPEILTGRDFNLAPLGRRQIQANCASARGGHKDRPTVMLFPFRSMCLPVQDVIKHGNSKERGQPVADPAGTMGTRSVPQGKHRNSARSLRGRIQEQNWTSDELSSEQKENCLDHSLEPLRLPLPAVGAREPVCSPSLCSPVVTIGDLVLDSDDEGNGQRGGKKFLESYQKTKFGTLIPTFCDYLSPVEQSSVLGQAPSCGQTDPIKTQWLRSL